MPPIWFMSSFGFKTQYALGFAVKCWSPNFTCRELFQGKQHMTTFSCFITEFNSAKTRRPSHTDLLPKPLCD